MTFNEIRRRPAGVPLTREGLHPLLRRVYASRGVSCAEDYRLELNEYRGAVSVQLDCQHLRWV